MQMADDLFNDLEDICEARIVYTAPENLRDALEGMLGELQSQRLEVGLAPSKDLQTAFRGGKVRQVQSTNPDWYRQFAAQFSARRSVPRNRKLHDTLIKRQGVMAVLQGLLANGTTSLYAPELLKAAQAYQEAQGQRFDAERQQYEERQKKPVLQPSVVQDAGEDLGLSDF